MRLPIAALALLASAAMACTGAVECTTEAVFGVSVAVFDAAGARVCSAVVTAKGEGVDETLQVFPGDSADCVYIGLTERPGTFTITATSARFTGQLSKVVTIEKGECHVVSQVIELRP